jgi:hypothetical protein
MAFKKILVHVNQNAIDSELNQLRTTVKYFQEYTDRIVNIVQKTGIVYHPQRIKVSIVRRVKVNHLQRMKVNH